MFTWQGYTSGSRLVWTVRNVLQLWCPGNLLHLNLLHNPEPGLIPGPPGYGVGRCWSWHTANWWNHLEPEKLGDQNHPETMFLNKLSRRWQKGGRGELVKREQTPKQSLYLCPYCMCGVVTCCALVPDFDRAVMGGCCYPRCTTRRRRQKHTAGCGLEMTSVLHNLTARLT